jgi:nitrite reductase/ring-hydroxylating ferredoxin subunit
VKRKQKEHILSTSQFEKVAEVSEVPLGKTKIVKLSDGIEIFVVNVDGQFYALQNRCTHMRGSLGRGKLNGSIIQCPLHGSKFDVTTGAVLSGPATQPEPTVELKIENSAIWAKKN